MDARLIPCAVVSAMNHELSKGLLFGHNPGP
jgi:hypothetical protein